MREKNDFRFYYSQSGKYNDLQRIGKRSQFLFVFNQVSKFFVIKIYGQSIKLTKQEATQFVSGRGLPLLTTPSNYDSAEGVKIKLNGKKEPIFIPDYWFKQFFIPRDMRFKEVLQNGAFVNNRRTFNENVWVAQILRRYGE